MLAESLQFIGWIASICAIGSYLFSVHYKKPLVFDWVNVVASSILVPIDIYFGIGFAAFLSASFGLVGLYALYRHYIHK